MLKVMPEEAKVMPTQAGLMPTQSKTVPTQENHVKEQFGLVMEQQGVKTLQDNLLGLSKTQLALGTTRALSRGLSARLTEQADNETILTLLPTAPTPKYPQLQTTLKRQANSQVRGALKITMDSREHGVIPKAWEIHLAIFDAAGVLLSTAKTELPGAGGTADVALGLCPKAQHYQIELSPKPSPEKEELIVAGYQVVALGGKVPPPLMGTLGEPHFAQSNYYKDISANLSVSVASLSDAPGYTIHGAVFDEKGALLSTDQAALQSKRDQGISFSFGKRSQLATRYQLAITAPPTAPDASFTVASTRTEADGSLTLNPPPKDISVDEALKNSELRDYTRIKLMPAVVGALKAKGITELVGTHVAASGKSERSIYLSFPAFEVTTIVVEKLDDLQIQMESIKAQSFLKRLHEAKNGQGRYPLLISAEFSEVLLAAARRGDEASVIALVQYSWFGGPEEAVKGGNGVTWAAYCPTAEPVKILLEHSVSASVADASGNTGLHRTYRPEIAELLLKHKAPTEAKNADGETPLLAQSRQADRWLGRVAVVQALLSAGANPNVTDNQGRTPLMWAAKSGLPDLVERLLKSGADPKRKDKDGKTARDYIAAWQWGTAPGLLTVEGAEQLKHDAEADRVRVEELLGGN